MHERTPVLDTGEEDYNLDGSGEFRVGHKFKSREAVLQGVKNYSIRKSADADKLIMGVNGASVWHFDRTSDTGNIKFICVFQYFITISEVRRVGGVHACLAPTMSQDYCQLDNSLICRVILPLIQSNPSVSIPVLQSAVQASYHFKLSYRKVWMAKQKVIAQIYGDWEESYNKVLKLLQAMQSYFSSTICDLCVKPFYDGHFLVRDYSMFDKVFWSFPLCVEAFKHCKPFVSVDGTHLYGRYGGVLLIAVAQDVNSNILPIAFAIVESESTESWSFFLTNLRRHVTPQDGSLVISDKSQAIKVALSADDSGWHPPRANHAYCIRHMTANFMTRFKSAEGKRYLINAAYSPSKAGYKWYIDALRGVSPTMVEWACSIGHTVKGSQDRRWGGICQTRSCNQTSFSVNDSFLYAACFAATRSLAPSSCSTITHVSVLYHRPKSRRHPQRGFRVHVGSGGTLRPAG
ncbi:uncharacterized protein LOC107487317 [Arachis duranensis]|uniref:Uncharacterized protein LOC107487317 n=1 Tax=Arachis duranensis TaxID=130453 RepID=A0A6P4D729_ARADU|nr:uncharacterized protein LOC107487317 [Arachis duranensis]